MRFKSQGIILSRRTIRETDLMLSILTRDRGRISASARGAQRSLKRFLGGVDLFDCGVFEFSASAKSRGLLTLESISERKVWLGLRNDLVRFSLGMLLLELTQQFLPEDEADGGRMYEPLEAALMRLTSTTEKGEVLIIAVLFLLVILDFGGYSPLANGQTTNGPNNRQRGALRFFDDDGLMLVANVADPRMLFDEGVIAALLGDEVKPFNPEQISMLADDLFYLLDYAEQILGHALKTREGVVAQALT